MLQRRRSIHPDDNLCSGQETNENLLQCESCTKKIIVYEDKTEAVLDESCTQDYVTLQKKKTDVDIDLENLPRFKCKDCKLSVVTPSSLPVETPSSRASYKWLLCLLICVLLLCLYTKWEDIEFYYKRSKDIKVNTGVKTSAEIRLEKELDELEVSYNKQDEDTWITFIAGIKSVIQENPNKPSVFLLLFDSESAGKTAQCIAKDASKRAIKYIMQKSDTPTVINGADLNNHQFDKDSGLFLKELNHTVREKGAVVITNLHEVPPNVAKMFHFLCDTYAPLVETAVAFFTLKVEQLPSVKDQQKTADETMKNLWSSVLEDNVLHPLITRMTTNIVRIYPDSSC